MSIIGADDNIHPKSLQQAIEEASGQGVTQRAAVSLLFKASSSCP